MEITIFVKTILLFYEDEYPSVESNWSPHDLFLLLYGEDKTSANYYWMEVWLIIMIMILI
jgi:hypothetical protein